MSGWGQMIIYHRSKSITVIFLEMRSYYTKKIKSII